ncbi:MAG: pilus assembly protein N-terminal domain-containing protein, partial [Stellaceae bacterium]
MKRVTLALAALLALAAPAINFSAVPAQAAPRGTVPATGPALEIAVNEGKLVRLSKPVNSVFIADPKIADVQVKSPSIIYVIGKSAGMTTL